ncbi:MAG: hypothetical protein JWS12_375 [Candidatus Saccharibacteria bacterium]|nr:hypothetical protein [Candidatus Saccharibacteria bacterium]
MEQEDPEREDTTFIVERVLGEEDITFEKVLEMLGVYYWWTDDWQQPQDYIDALIYDVGIDGLPELATVLHDNVDTCSISTPEYKCPLSGSVCFGEYLESQKVDAATEPDSEMLEHFSYWADSLTEDDEEYPNTLIRAYKRYVADKLTEAGATDLEVGNALEVLELEADRRQLVGNTTLKHRYRDFRLANGTYKEFLAQYLANDLMAEGTFKNIYGQREDHEKEAHDLTEAEKRAIVQHYIEDLDDFYQLLEVSFQKYTYGVLPYYLYRFTEFNDLGQPATD